MLGRLPRGVWATWAAVQITVCTSACSSLLEQQLGCANFPNGLFCT